MLLSIDIDELKLLRFARTQFPLKGVFNCKINS